MVLSTRRSKLQRSPLKTESRLDRTLYQVECLLTDPDTRGSRSQLEQLIHPDFTETGSTGNVYDRETIINMMLTEAPGAAFIRDFQSHTLTADTAFVTYRSVGESGQEARRSSIWIRTKGHWQLRYHQGTRVPNTWGTIN